MKGMQVNQSFGPLPFLLATLGVRVRVTTGPIEAPLSPD